MTAETFAVITGGGTTGHVAPALAVASALVARGHPAESILFVGARRGIEARLVPEAGFPLLALPGGGIRRSLGIGAMAANAAAAAGLASATWTALHELRRRRPRVLVTVGGYASVPATAAAALLRIPIVVVSYDAVPGAASRLAGRVASASATAFAGPTALRHPVVTGAPVRPEVLDVSRSDEGRRRAREALGLEGDRFVVAVTSGSGGARRVNQAAAGLARLWSQRQDVAIYHAVGRRDFPDVLASTQDLSAGGVDYRPVEYEQRLPLVLAACDLAVARAGASTVAELTVIGTPAILVPLPGAPGDHQTLNARHLADAGAAVVLPDAECDAHSLARLVEELRLEPDRLRQMGKSAASLGVPDASLRIADLVERSALPPSATRGRSRRRRAA